VLVLVLGVALRGQQSPGSNGDASVRPPLALTFETGRVTVKGGLATIDLPPGFRYLQQDGARTVVEQVWRNRPNPNTLGLVLPPAEREWGGIIVCYIECGHVSDLEPDLDAETVLRDLRDEVAAGNAIRERMGVPPAELLGWADPPTYDPVGKTLRWGKVVRPGESAPMVNYEARILGAEGVLSFQAVADADRLEELRSGVVRVLEGTALAAGLRYADHDPSRHRLARKGLRSLIVTETMRVPMFRVLLKPVIAVLVVLTALVSSARRRR